MKTLSLKNETLQLLKFVKDNNNGTIDIIFEKGDIWARTDMIAKLYNIDRSGVTKHTNNILKDGELDEKVVCAKFAHTTKHGASNNKTQTKNINYWNLDMIIALGYRINSEKAINFRRWATSVLKEFAKKGYIIDRKRMENGKFFDEDYFEHLLEEIREIRLSGRRLYQKVTDIYATSSDYDKDSPTTKKFYAMTMNKLHWAVHQHTASELIHERVDSNKKNMGLETWENAPKGKIMRTDVSIAKNYLTKEELESLGRIVNAYLDLAEDRAKKQIPMTMHDWSTRLDKFLLADDRELLKNTGMISMQVAKDKAESEFEKFRVIQDKKFESDFDEFLKLEVESNKW